MVEFLPIMAEEQKQKNVDDELSKEIEAIKMKAVLKDLAGAIREYNELKQQFQVEVEKSRLLQEERALRKKYKQSLRSNIESLQKELSWLDEELATVKMGLCPELKQLRREYELVKEGVEKATEVLEKTEAVYEQLPLAKQRQTVKTAYLKSKVELAVQEWRADAQNEMDNMFERITQQRLQAAIIELAKAYKWRKEKLKELKTVDLRNAELEKELAALQQENKELAIRKFEKVKPKKMDRFLMPPSKISNKYSSDRFSTDNLDNVSVVSFAVKRLFESNTELLDDENKTSINISQQFDDAQSSFFDKANASIVAVRSMSLCNQEKSNEGLQHCSSTVGENVNELRPQGEEILDKNCRRVDVVEKHIIIPHHGASFHEKSNVDMCECSSTTDGESAVFRMHSEVQDFTRNNKVQKESAMEVDGTEKMELITEKNDYSQPRSLPQIKSVEKVSYNIFSKDAGPVSSMFSIQFSSAAAITEQQAKIEDKKAEESEDLRNMDKESEVNKIPVRSVSPVNSDMFSMDANFFANQRARLNISPNTIGEDVRASPSDISNFPFSSIAGNISPTDENNRGDEKSFLLGSPNVKISNQKQINKEPETSIYGAFQLKSDKPNFLNLFK